MDALKVCSILTSLSVATHGFAKIVIDFQHMQQQSQIKILFNFLQGAATNFQTREYIRERKKVEDALFKAVKERLGGVCCEPGCEKKGKRPSSQLLSLNLTSTQTIKIKFHILTRQK